MQIQLGLPVILLGSALACGEVLILKKKIWKTQIYGDSAFSQLLTFSWAAAKHTGYKSSGCKSI